MTSEKDRYNAREHVEILFVDVSEEQKDAGDFKNQLRILQEAVNEKLRHLQGGYKAPVGTLFQGKILDVKFISPSTAMIIADDKRLT